LFRKGLEIAKKMSKAAGMYENCVDESGGSGGGGGGGGGGDSFDWAEKEREDERERLRLKKEKIATSRYKRTVFKVDDLVIYGVEKVMSRVS
jgi:hypothetical protein